MPMHDWMMTSTINNYSSELLFEDLYMPVLYPADIQEVSVSPLEFVADVQTVEGQRLVNSMNGTEDSQPGEITLITTDGSITVSGDCIVPLRSTTTLSQNVPNPFNPQTTVLVALEREQRVQVSVFDLAGHRIRNLLREDRGPGEHAIVWDGRDSDGRSAASGDYFCRLKAGRFSETIRAVLLK